jgi:hypothetical protein
MFSTRKVAALASIAASVFLSIGIAAAPASAAPVLAAAATAGGAPYVCTAVIDASAAGDLLALVGISVDDVSGPVGTGCHRASFLETPQLLCWSSVNGLIVFGCTFYNK